MEAHEQEFASHMGAYEDALADAANVPTFMARVDLHAAEILGAICSQGMLLGMSPMPVHGTCVAARLLKRMRIVWDSGGLLTYLWVVVLFWHSFIRLPPLLLRY